MTLKEKLIKKWEEKYDLHKRVCEDTLMYTEERRKQNSHYIQVISAFLEDLKYIEFSEGISFNEYHDFHKWIIKEQWYEVCDGEYDNAVEPNSCIRLNIQELYGEYLKKIK